MINKDLLFLTESRALSFCTYGAAGLWKTHSIHSLVPPIEMDDWEGGTMSLLPWIRRRRSSSNIDWIEYTQDVRQLAFNMLKKEIRESLRIKPAPLIDVIRFDPTRVESYNEFVLHLGNFDTKYYNSLAIDSMQEFSAGTQTMSKGVGKEMLTMNEASGRAWAGAQERAKMNLRKLVNIRDAGVFVYVTAGEEIAKDYVTDPQSRQAGDRRQEEPYSVRGSVNLPGQLANAVPHAPDVLMHARLLNDKPSWIAEPEPLGGGVAWWDAKDRTGRLEKYQVPSFYQILKQIYGAEGVEKIYAHE